MLNTVKDCSAQTDQNRVTWKTPSSAAFVPLQEPVAVLAFLRSPHLNAGMKQYDCGRTQPSLCMVHNRGKTSMSKPKKRVKTIIINNNNHETQYLIITTINSRNLKSQNICANQIIGAYKIRKQKNMQKYERKKICTKTLEHPNTWRIQKYWRLVKTWWMIKTWRIQNFRRMVNTWRLEKFWRSRKSRWTR
jgi:hypothetical protein